jgi:hypothetical protein
MTQASGQAEVTSATAGDIVDRYIAVWNEPDPAARHAAVVSLWAPDGTEFLDGGTQFRGHDDLCARVARAHEAFVASGKYAVTADGDVARHHDIITFTAQLTAPGGAVDWAARVFLVVSGDGLIREDYHLVVKPLPASLSGQPGKER